jgi:hypothetical protein
LGGLFPLDAPGEPGSLDSDRMHRNIPNQFIDERLPPLPALFRSGALDAMRQLRDGHHGEADLDVSETPFKLFQYLPNGVAPPLPGNHHGRVED